MKIKIVFEIKSDSSQCRGKLVKTENEFVEFQIHKNEVEKLYNWGIISKSENVSNDKDIYTGELEIEDENK